MERVNIFKEENSTLCIFKVNAETKWGQSLFLIGNLLEIGSWNVEKAIPLKTNPSIYPLWISKEIRIPLMNNNVEYKYIKKADDKTIIWEDKLSGNRLLNAKLLLENIEVEINDKDFNRNEKQVVKMIKRKINEPVSPTMLKKETSKEIIERNYISKTFIGKIQACVTKVESLNKARLSWIGRLTGIYELLKEDDSLELLSVIATYVWLLRENYVPCKEEGQHQRPNNHSSEALKIHILLKSKITSDNSFVISHILRNLPSFSSQFRSSEPLTLIRDLAHRNTIPMELKKEIKESLQNKLHRSADPNDLITAEFLLVKIRNGDYDLNFKNDFEKFYLQLKEFFGGSDLNELIELFKNSLLESEFHNMYENIGQKIEEFINSKDKDSLKNPIGLITNLCFLRTSISAILDATFLNNMTVYQNGFLLDARLEEYLFALSSTLLNNLPKKIESDEDLDKYIHLCYLLLKNLITSNIYKDECEIIYNEYMLFMTFLSTISNNHRDYYLRLYSSAQRNLRLVYRFMDIINIVFQGAIFQLGERLNAPIEKVKILGESIIRSHVIFQLSKILQEIIEYFKFKLNYPPFIVLYPGIAKGVPLFGFNLLQAFGNIKTKEPRSIIAIVEKAEGDEEIPEQIGSIILKEEIPILSHLAIRIRESRIISIACTSAQYFETLLEQFSNLQSNIQSKRYKIEIENFKINILELELQKMPTEEIKEIQKIEEKQIEEIDKETDIPDYSLLKMLGNIPKNVGAKASNMWHLKNLSNDSKKFKTPQSFCIPYECFSYYLNKGSEFQLPEILKDLDKSEQQNILKNQEKIITVLDILFENFKGENIIEKLANQIQVEFSPETLLALRSSSNFEDIKGLTSAGLFDSVLSVRRNNIKDILSAMIHVWKSLFSKNASLYMHRNKIPIYKAKMAILIQELIDFDYCFVVHTRNPSNRSNDEILIEVAQGLGEVLVGAKDEGMPYRFVFNKTSKQIEILSFANYSYKYVSSSSEGKCIRTKVDYSTCILSTNIEEIKRIVSLIGEISILVEETFKYCADIEGGIKNGEIYLVQVRPVQE